MRPLGVGTVTSLYGVSLWEAEGGGFWGAWWRWNRMRRRRTREILIDHTWTRSMSDFITNSYVVIYIVPSSVAIVSSHFREPQACHLQSMCVCGCVCECVGVRGV